MDKQTCRYTESIMLCPLFFLQEEAGTGVSFSVQHLPLFSPCWRLLWLSHLVSLQALHCADLTCLAHLYWSNCFAFIASKELGTWNIALILWLSETHRSKSLRSIKCLYCFLCLLIWNDFSCSEITAFEGQVLVVWFVLLPMAAAAENPQFGLCFSVLYFKMNLLTLFVACHFLIWIFCSPSSCCRFSPKHFLWFLLNSSFTSLSVILL